MANISRSGTSGVNAPAPGAPAPGAPTRRGLLAATLALPWIGTRPATAQPRTPGWPNRPVAVVVPFAAGGSNDVIARIVAPRLQAAFGQPFVVDNRGGAGGSIGTAFAARAAPDGHTLLLTSVSSHVMNPLVVPGLGLDPREAFAGVSLVEDVPLALSVPAASPARDLAGLVALLKREPGKHSYGSSGVGGSQHLAGALFGLRAGVDIVHVPYRGGGPALNDLVSGQLSMGFLNLPTAFPQAQAGTIRILAVAGERRSRLRPEIPTVAEAGVPGYAVRSWTALFAPRGTPEDVLSRLSAALREALGEPAMRERLAEQGIEPQTSTPAELDRFVRDEFATWEPVIRAANITAG